MATSLFTDTLTQNTAETDANFSLRVQQYVSDQQFYFEQAGGSFPVQENSQAIGYPPTGPATSTLAWDVTAAQFVRQVTFVYDNTYYFKYLGTVPPLPAPSPLPGNGNVAIWSNGVLADGVLNVDTTLPQFTNLDVATLAGQAVEYSQFENFSAKIKAQRLTTGVVPAASSSVVTLTWAVPYDDDAYTVTVSVQDATADVLSLALVHVESKTDTDITVRIRNGAAVDITGTLHAIAIHD
jgi:hypothetical protein